MKAPMKPPPAVQAVEHDSGALRSLDILEAHLFDRSRPGGDGSLFLSFVSCLSDLAIEPHGLMGKDAKRENMERAGEEGRAKVVLEPRGARQRGKEPEISEHSKRERSRADREALVKLLKALARPEELGSAAWGHRLLCQRLPASLPRWAAAASSVGQIWLLIMTLALCCSPVTLSLTAEHMRGLSEMVAAALLCGWAELAADGTSPSSVASQTVP